jgi:hypothetical protein
VESLLPKVPIKNADDLQDWIKATGQRPDSQFVATYIIDKDGLLLIADRRSEHVACAGGKPVASADEMTFLVEGNQLEVIEVSNQSTLSRKPGRRLPLPWIVSACHTQADSLAKLSFVGVRRAIRSTS